MFFNLGAPATLRAARAVFAGALSVFAAAHCFAQTGWRVTRGPYESLEVAFREGLPFTLAAHAGSGACSAARHPVHALLAILTAGATANSNKDLEGGKQ